MTKQSKPTVTLAAISPDTATQVAKGLVRAATKAEGATRTLLQEMCGVVRTIGVPLTAAQWSKQVQPSLRDAFKRSKAGLAETTVASYLSRFKTAGLAILSQDASLQPVAGETFPAFLARVAEPLGNAKLPDGRPIYDADMARPGRAAGSKSTPSTSGGVSSVGSVNRQEGGMDERPRLAAALILCDQNVARAQRVAIVLESYASEFDRWCESILTDADKRELEAKVAKPADDKPAPKATTRKAA